MERVSSCPSQRAMTDTSTPAWSRAIAAVWRSTWGVTFLPLSDGQRTRAMPTWRATRRCTASGLSRRPVRVGTTGQRRARRVRGRRAQHGDGVGGQGHDPLLATLAGAAQVGTGAECDIAAVEAGELSQPQPGLNGDGEHGPVAPSFPTARVGGGEQRLGFVVGEEGDDGLVVSLLGDGEHPGDQLGVFGVAESGVAEQGPDGGEAVVAGPGRVVPVSFQMRQEGADDVGADVVEAQSARGLAGSFGHEAQQQPEAVSVGGDGGRAGLTLADETFGEEPLQGRGEQAHRVAAWAASSRAAAWPNNSGVALR